jgi:hypothetical protein
LVEASLQNRSAEPDSDMRAARLALNAAEDEVRAAGAVRAGLLERIPIAEARTWAAGLAVNRAAQAVMQSEIALIGAALVEDFQHIRDRFGRQSASNRVAVSEQVYHVAR